MHFAGFTRIKLYAPSFSTEIKKEVSHAKCKSKVLIAYTVSSKELISGC